MSGVSVITERPAGAGLRLSPAMARAGLILVVGLALLAGLLVTPAPVTAVAAAHAGGALTRLLRAMAMIKMLLAACALAGVLWRLGAAVTVPWLVAYAVAAGAMAAGPGLIWGMAHVGLGALLLHGGLLASVLLLWRDPGMARRLEDTIARRRAAIGVRAR